VEVIYYQLNAEPKRHRVPNRMIDILRTCGKLGATYPDIVQMMIEAEQQHNFVGQFGIDRLPQAGRLYTKNTESPSPADEEDAKRIGNSKMIPELFDELDEDELKENESEEKLMNLNFEEVRKEDEKQSKTPGGSKPGEDSERTAEQDSEMTSEESSNDEADSETPAAKDQSADAESVKTDAEDSDSEESTTEESDVLEEAEPEAAKKSLRERLFGKKKSSVSGLTEPAE
jgi:hypothetical protein